MGRGGCVCEAQGEGLISATLSPLPVQQYCKSARLTQVTICRASSFQCYPSSTSPWNTQAKTLTATYSLWCNRDYYNCEVTTQAFELVITPFAPHLMSIALFTAVYAAVARPGSVDAWDRDSTIDTLTSDRLAVNLVQASIA